MLSVYVICWIFLQTFQTYFYIQANSVDLKEQSDLGPHCLQKWLLKMTRQTTIVVTGSLRVKINTWGHVAGQVGPSLLYLHRNVDWFVCLQLTSKH